MQFKALFIVVTLAMVWGVEGIRDEQGIFKKRNLNKTNQDLTTLKALNDAMNINDLIKTIKMLVIN